MESHPRFASTAGVAWRWAARACACYMTRLLNFDSDFDFITCGRRRRRQSIEQLIINLIQSKLIYFRQLPFMLFIWISVGDWRIASRRSVADTCGNGCVTVWWREMCGVFIKSFCRTNKYKTVLKAWAQFRKDRVTTNFNNNNCDAEKILIFIFRIFGARHLPSCLGVCSTANKFALHLSHRYFLIRRTWCNEMINE